MYFYPWRLKILNCDIKSLRLVKVQHTWEPAAIQKVQYVCVTKQAPETCVLCSQWCVFYMREPKNRKKSS